MTNTTYQQAAKELLSRRVADTKAPRLNEEFRPKSIEDALNIQAELVKQHTDTVGGWKCLLPPSDEKKVVAPIFSKTVQRGETCELDLADCLMNQGLFIGPEIDREKAFSANLVEINITQDEKTQTFAGKHPNAAPLKPIHWLIDFMTRRGTSFKAGEAITTGSFCGIVEVEFNKLTTINYANIGEYQVTLNVK